MESLLAGRGVEQVLDTDSGIPTVGSMHEVAQQINLDASLDYVDIDPIAVARRRAMLKENPTAAAIQADARRSNNILAHPEARKLLDLKRPAAVLLLLILHVIPANEEAHGERGDAKVHNWSVAGRLALC